MQCFLNFLRQRKEYYNHCCAETPPYRRRNGVRWTTAVDRGICKRRCRAEGMWTNSRTSVEQHPRRVEAGHCRSSGYVDAPAYMWGHVTHSTVSSVRWLGRKVTQIHTTLHTSCLSVIVLSPPEPYRRMLCSPLSSLCVHASPPDEYHTPRRDVLAYHLRFAHRASSFSPRHFHPTITSPHSPGQSTTSTPAAGGGATPAEPEEEIWSEVGPRDCESPVPSR